MIEENPLVRLQKGNERFYSGLKSVHSLTSAYRLGELAEKGQNPFAIIVCCSDSRVPAETVFDQGLGDLFVIRVAGNVINQDMVASLELAVLTFNTPLCLIMGHSRCGAITASVDAFNSGDKLPSENLEQLIRKIDSSIERVNDPKIRSDREVFIDHVTVENVKNSMNEIVKKSLIIQNRIKNNQFVLAGSVYDINSGKVNFF